MVIALLSPRPPPSPPPSFLTPAGQGWRGGCLGPPRLLDLPQHRYRVQLELCLFSSSVLLERECAAEPIGVHGSLAPPTEIPAQHAGGRGLGILIANLSSGSPFENQHPRFPAGSCPGVSKNQHSAHRLPAGLAGFQTRLFLWRGQGHSPAWIQSLVKCFLFPR